MAPTRHEPGEPAPEGERDSVYQDLPSVDDRQWRSFAEEASGAESPAPGSPGFRGIGPRQSRSDRAIQEDINELLTADDHIDAREVTVVVTSGVATLSGTLPERGMKHRTEDLVSGCRGVNEVNNHIRISHGEESFGPRGQPVRSGQDQQGSGFSSSERTEITDGRLGSTGAEGVADIPQPGKAAEDRQD